MTVANAGALGATDIEHLRFAERERGTIFIQDDDFLRPAASGEPHAGILYTPKHTSVRAMIPYLMLVHSALSAELPQRLRKSANGGFVLGSPQRRHQIAAMLGRRTWKPSPGRSRNEADTGGQAELAS